MISARAVLGLTVVLIGIGPSAGAAELAGTTNKPEAVPYDAKGRRDPFVPLVKDGRILAMINETPSRSVAMVLQGVLWDPGGQSIALIGETEAKVGDTINGYQLIEIRRDAVVLSNGGEQVVLQLQFEATAAPADAAGGSER